MILSVLFVNSSNKVAKTIVAINDVIIKNALESFNPKCLSNIIGILCNMKKLNVCSLNQFKILLFIFIFIINIVIKNEPVK